MLQVGDVILVEIGKHSARQQVKAQVVQINPRSVFVRLPDGRVVKRKVGRDFDASLLKRVTQ